MFKGIDLSSDTATRPTVAMRAAMCAAVVGDEQKNEDPTTRQLEDRIAEMFGFSAALFLPSATMANEIALRHLCERGDELLAAASSHLFFAEGGGPAIHANVMCKPIATPTGIFTADELQQHYTVSKGPHYPISQLISVENTTNMGGGIAWSKAELQSVVNAADALGLKKHMDGARVFNASIKTGLSPKEIAAGFDTVTICLSKGLGCPGGALLAFDKKEEPRVRRFKHMMGGAMRQSGMMASAGIYALQHHVTRLQEDHDNATLLANLIHDQVPEVVIRHQMPSTNMVFFEWRSNALTPNQFHDRCIARGLRFSQVAPTQFRAVTHLDIKKDDIEKAIHIMKDSLYDPLVCFRDDIMSVGVPLACKRDKSVW